MRTHNHLKIKEKCRCVLPKLMQKHGLGEVLQVEMDTEGWVNPCFFVNDSYVIRFNARDPNLPKYQREKIVFDLLKDLNFPVPGRVLLDTDKDIIEYDVLLSQKVEGRNLEFDWKKLTEADQATLATQAGALLKGIHAIKWDGFGEIAGHGPLPRTKDWFQFLKAKLDFLFFEARKINLYSNVLEEKFYTQLIKNEEALNTIKEAALVHIDFHFGNLIYKGTEIKSVVDFEWAIAGDPLYDLMFWQDADEIFPNSKRHFFEGYGKSDFSTQELKLITVYQMMKNIELSIVAALHFPSAEAEDYLGKAVDYLEKMS